MEVFLSVLVVRRQEGRLAFSARPSRQFGREYNACDMKLQKSHRFFPLDRLLEGERCSEKPHESARSATASVRSGCCIEAAQSIPDGGRSLFLYNSHRRRKHWSSSSHASTAGTASATSHCRDEGRRRAESVATGNGEKTEQAELPGFLGDVRGMGRNGQGSG